MAGRRCLQHRKFCATTVEALTRSRRADSMRCMRFANIRPPGWLPVFGLMLFAAWLPLCAAAAEDAAERRFL